MAKKKKERKIPEVLVFTDVNRYPDDLASFVVLAYLADKKLINIKGIITELGTYEIRRRRAIYAKGAMVELGQPFLRVAPGGDYEVQDEADNTFPENEIADIFAQHGMTILRSGTTFVQEYIKSVKERNVYVLLNAPFPDFAKYVRAASEAVKKKVKKIVVGGNVVPQKNEKGFYQPDAESFNFKVGWPAAQELFDYAQEKEVRLVVVRPEDVKTLQMKYEFLEDLQASKNPVARQLIADKNNNPVSMQYDMLSALALADGEFKRAGGVFEQEEDAKVNVSFAKVADAETLRAKFCEIFREKLAPKKISLAQLMRPKEENKEESKE